MEQEQVEQFHCLLGLDVLNRTKVLEALDETEKHLIEKAIEYHGRKHLPENLDGQCLFFSKLIRDADKLDIFLVVIDLYTQYTNDPIFSSLIFGLRFSILDLYWGVFQIKNVEGFTMAEKNSCGLSRRDCLVYRILWG